MSLLFLQVLQDKTLMPFASYFLFKDAGIVKSLEDRDKVLPFRAKRAVSCTVLSRQKVKRLTPH